MVILLGLMMLIWIYVIGDDFDLFYDRLVIDGKIQVADLVMNYSILQKEVTFLIGGRLMQVTW